MVIDVYSCESCFNFQDTNRLICSTGKFPAVRLQFVFVVQYRLLLMNKHILCKCINTFYNICTVLQYELIFRGREDSSTETDE